MKRGVINIVEILILIIIFLSVAVLFGSYLLNATSKQSQTLQQEQENVMLTLNPPVKVIGIIQASVDLDNDGTNDTVPVACVQETAGGMWWLSDVILRAGTMGTVLVNLNTGRETADLLKSVDGNLTFQDEIAKVVYSPLTPKDLKGDNTTNVLLVCVNSTNGIINVTASNFICDKDYIENVLNDYVTNVCSGSGNVTEIYNLVQFLPPGSTAPVVIHPIYSSSNWNYTSYSVSIYFAKKVKPNPQDIPLRKYSGESVTSAEVLNVLRESGNLTTFTDVFKAGCGECTFYVG